MKNFIKVIIPLILFTSKVIGQPNVNFTKNVNDAELITTDIKNFIYAFNSLSKDKDTIQVLQIEYFTFMNLLSIIPDLILSFLQKQNIKINTIPTYSNKIDL